MEKHSGSAGEKQNGFTAQKEFIPKVIFLKDSGKTQRIEDNRATAVQVASVRVPQQECDLERIMQSYGNSLLRLCFMYVKDRQLAEDAVQETFIKVYKNYHRYDGGASEKTWINRIAVNVCKDMLRSAYNRRVNVVETLNEVPVQGDFTDGMDDTLVREVMELKPKYKEVILLFYYEDMKISDIAQVLDAPESTISVRLKRAREALAKKLGAWYYGE